MSVLIDKNTRLLVQGITGSQGMLHTRGCRYYGTNVVSGVTPGKGGQDFISSTLDKMKDIVNLRNDRNITIAGS